MSTLFEWLDEVRRRPSMYFATLRDLQMLVDGYSTALWVHSVDEGFALDSRHFGAWLRLRRGWSLSCGWAAAVTSNSRSEADAAQTFFALLDEFRELRPTVRARVRMKKHHQATGRHAVIGFGGRLEVPRVIEVVQYAPEPLYFLRFHHAKRRVDMDVLHDNGANATSLRFAKQWVEEEFQVRADEWEQVPAKKR
ncbi:hypothetical protein [Pyxidicoccus xibeiensis]|uniref:hypothetical protein n=1 Tax=Pyxidicoccus xibeiensis TaxID=2906759 RepID=UPI0020A82A59|nr:hypothetical protein [Pyxidicoccus xibeiensis]MCP3142703.1 hypothetical protein [Pyxidicoccus xibeiensis]